jgi:hypothetical protein
LINGRAPVYATLLALSLLAVVLLLVQPYSADWPGTDYAEPARRYIRAAIGQDSAALAGVTATDEPVRWAMWAARRHPGTLALWQRRLQAFVGERRGDTTEVFVYPPGERCGQSPIVLRFLGSGATARVIQASSACLHPGCPRRAQHSILRIEP